MRFSRPRRNLFALLLLAVMLAPAGAQQLAEPHRCIYPEQRRVQARGPHEIWGVQRPNLPPPITVSVPDCFLTGQVGAGTAPLRHLADDW